MKKGIRFLSIVAIAFSAMCFVSCKSGGDTTEFASIIGKWQGYAMSQDGNDWTEVSTNEMIVMDFHKDSTYTQTEKVTVYEISSQSNSEGSNQERVEDGTWSLQDSTLTLNKSFQAGIVKLDKEEMVLTFRQKYVKYRRLTE